MNQKNLFIPLKTEFYNAFADGSKRSELRTYGARWNEKTCFIGRKVTLSKGYGKQSRIEGTITKFDKLHGETFGINLKADILSVYGTLDIFIACISIEII